MPTYTFRCPKCGADASAFLSIREYCAAPPVFVCCAAPMERFFEVVPGLALHNALAGDRHYDGLRTPDGTDVSTRTKHRDYMKRNNLTMADDFKGEWRAAAQARADIRDGTDPARREDVARALAKHSPA
jgi:hypothetical protein